MKKPKPITVKFLGTVCTVDFEEYQNNGRTAISLNEKSTGDPFMVATVNLPDVPLEKDEVIIKNYSENEGILDVLIQAGIVSKPIRKVPTGYVYADVCKLLYSNERVNEPQKQKTMINTSNYFDYFRNNNVLSRFPQAAPLHDFIVMVTNGGKDWSAYQNEPEVKETIDTYFAKLEGKETKTPSRNSTSSAVRYNPADHKHDNDDSGSGARSRKQRKNARKTKATKKYKSQTTKRKQAKRPGKKAKRKARKVLNLPKGKLVELVDPHLLFVGRFLRMNNQKRTRNALEKFFSQINHAADARILRKTSAYAHHILYIQKQLLKYLEVGTEEVAVQIPSAKFDELLRAVAKEQQMASVRLLKRYHNMAGRPTTIEKATKLYNEFFNAVEKGKIPENDRLFKRVVKVMRDLSEYVKAEDTKAELVRLPAELGGVLGFMDGCLCHKDREVSGHEAPADVNFSFRK